MRDFMGNSGNMRYLRDIEKEFPENASLYKISYE